MPELRTQADFRGVRSLDFCYLCGKGFTGRYDKTRDHVPPRAIFAGDDREPALILPTHRCCNEGQSGYDEVIGQLVSVIHGKYPSPDNMRLDIRVMPTDDGGTPFLGFVGTNLHNVIRRWLRGFHSAIYREFLPDATKNYLHTPFPSGNINENNDVAMEGILEQQPLFVETIKKNRVAKTLDRVECCNGQCVYECVWETSDDGKPMCIFALRVYDWKRLAGTDRFPPRGCVGMYMPESGRPVGGTKSTCLQFSFENADKLDPFAP